MIKKIPVFLLSISVIIIVIGCEVGLNDTNSSIPTGNSESVYREPEFGHPGKVVLAREIKLSFPIGGKIIELLVDEGDTVNPGQIIAKLDTSSIDREIAHAEASLVVAQANFNRAQVGPHETLIKEAELKVTAVAAQRSLNSVQATAQVIDIAAAEAQRDYLVAQPFPEDISVAKAELDQAKSTLEGFQEMLEQTTLVAPSSGNIIQLLAYQNEYTQAGEPILRIGDFSELIIEALVDESEIIDVNIGDQANIMFDSLPEVEYLATVYSITPIDYDSDFGDFVVRLSTDQPIANSYWGLRVEVFFEK
jgi:HlyD family secretion protein